MRPPCSEVYNVGPPVLPAGPGVDHEVQLEEKLRAPGGEEVERVVSLGYPEHGVPGAGQLLPLLGGEEVTDHVARGPTLRLSGAQPEAGHHHVGRRELYGEG